MYRKFHLDPENQGDDTSEEWEALNDACDNYSDREPRITPTKTLTMTMKTTIGFNV